MTQPVVIEVGSPGLSPTVELATHPALVFIDLPTPYGGITVELPGVKGEPGESGVREGARYLSPGALSGGRVVLLNAAGLAYPSLSAPLDAYAVIGITPGAVEPDAWTTLNEAGAVMNEPSWNWTPSQLIYVGDGGVLTALPPPTGWLRVFGVALSSTRLLVAPREPIMRTE